MAHVIKIEWIGGPDGPTAPAEHDGRFISQYNPNFQDGLGQVRTVSDPRLALKFASHAEAVNFYLQTSTVKPLRDDGKPNRPLTAFTISIFDLEAPPMDTRYIECGEHGPHRHAYIVCKHVFDRNDRRLIAHHQPWSEDGPGELVCAIPGNQHSVDDLMLLCEDHLLDLRLLLPGETRLT